MMLATVGRLDPGGRLVLDQVDAGACGVLPGGADQVLWMLIGLASRQPPAIVHVGAGGLAALVSPRMREQSRLLPDGGHGSRG